MKLSSVVSHLIPVSFLFLGTQAAMASAGPTWSDLQKLVQDCALQPVEVNAEGQETYELMESICPSLRKVDASHVEFKFDGQLYRAEIQTSADADGDDLEDLTIVDLKKQTVAHAETILAFGDPILALALGSNTGVRQLVRSVTRQ